MVLKVTILWFLFLVNVREEVIAHCDHAGEVLAVATHLLDNMSIGFTFIHYILSTKSKIRGSPLLRFVFLIEELPNHFAM